jgi:hypothetical protein
MKIFDWLGEGTQLIRNKARDPVFLSKGRLRKVCFDLTDLIPTKALTYILSISLIMNGKK